MKCSKCETEYTGKFCPNCAAPAREIKYNSAPKKKKTWLIVVAVIIVALFLVIGILGSQDSGPKIVGESTPPSTPSQSSAPEETAFGVGDKVEMDNIVVTLNSVSEEAGSDFNKPSDGKVFVLCSFNIENNSTSDISISSLLSFDAYFDDYSTSISLGAMIGNDEGQLDGTIAAGKKMKGVVGYEAPSDWETLEIGFTPSFWSGKDIIFTASN